MFMAGTKRTIFIIIRQRRFRTPGEVKGPPAPPGGKDDPSVGYKIITIFRHEEIIIYS